MSETKILIVGAGPVGLTLANLLTHHGIDYQIIDKHPSSSILSKALAMHAKTLELFEELDLSNEFIDAGRVVKEAYIYADHKPLTHLDLSTIPSKYNMVLSIEQSQTEKVLESRLNKLGKKVSWNNELIEIKINTKNNQVKILDENKEIQEKEFDYVFSCEGAHSLMRKAARIDFAGASYKQGFLLADVLADSQFKAESLYGFLSQDSIFAVIPLKADNYWRIITTVANDYPTDLKNPNIEDVLKVTESSRPKNFNIQKTTWVSYFHVHHRIVDKYRIANIFLLGDAAHIHSPIGGQGMNAGMHDAFNLAQKLVAVIRNGADPEILDLYDKERRKVGKQIINGTDLATRIIVGRNLWTHNLQKLIVPIAFNNPVIKKNLVKNLAMLNQHVIR